MTCADKIRQANLATVVVGSIGATGCVEDGFQDNEAMRRGILARWYND